MFRTYKTSNPTMKFSKDKFINKLLDGVTLFRVIPGVTWTQSIYIYIYMREREREREREKINENKNRRQPNNFLGGSGQDNITQHKDQTFNTFFFFFLDEPNF